MTEYKQDVPMLKPVPERPRPQPELPLNIPDRQEPKGPPGTLYEGHPLLL